VTRKELGGNFLLNVICSGNLQIINTFWWWCCEGLRFELGALHLESRGFALGKQALYRLSLACSAFCSGYFGEGAGLEWRSSRSQPPKRHLLTFTGQYTRRK
jgi:hypothetical protein